jgi:MoaA/NifB/PqqE/SkfB family radical SAM enzyme
MLASLRRRLRSVFPPAPPAEDHLYASLASIDGAIAERAPLGSFLELLDRSKPEMFERVNAHFESPTVSKAVTVKVLNLCLAKYHFRMRHTRLASRPFGLLVDPSNVCNLACPGCVHSAVPKEQKIFIWGTGMLSEDRMTALLDRYGPTAIHVVFCNYGEPAVNPETPKYIRLAKSHLMGAMLSTNLSLERFDAEAYVNSGLDYMSISIDGATQGVYEKFRKKGSLELVLRNVQRLVEAKRRLGKRTPVLAWHLLAFEHNAHEIPAAREMARQLGVDAFRALTPFDVSWDDPNVRVASVEPTVVEFNPRAQADVVANWNPFPEGLNTAAIDREFETPWVSHGDEAPSVSESTCHWLYKSLSMDSNGTIFPCGGAPRPGVDLIFDTFQGARGNDPYNSEKYRLARLSFADRRAYEEQSASLGLSPHCAKCEWSKETANTDRVQIRQYFKSAGGALFSEKSLGVLSSW